MLLCTKNVRIILCKFPPYPRTRTAEWEVGGGEIEGWKKQNQTEIWSRKGQEVEERLRHLIGWRSKWLYPGHMVQAV